MFVVLLIIIKTLANIRAQEYNFRSTNVVPYVKKKTILLWKLSIQIPYLTCCRYLKTLKFDKYSTVFTISVLYKNVNCKILVTLEVTFSNDYTVKIRKSRRNNACGWKRLKMVLKTKYKPEQELLQSFFKIIFVPDAHLLVSYFLLLV